MRPGEEKADTAQHTGLRVVCGQTGRKSFFYRFRSPVTQKLTQVTLGYYPEMSLLDARTKHYRLKVIRDNGECPKQYLKQIKAEKKAFMENAESDEAINGLRVSDVIELYLTQYIESRTVNGKLIKGARAPKGQKEARRTLEVDVKKTIGDKPAASLTKRDVKELINNIVGRGAPVQAGNVLREFNAAYEQGESTALTIVPH